jgi:hypothetical protein
MATNITAHGFDITGPSTPPSALYMTTGGAMVPGPYQYKVSYMTHYGETLASPPNAGFTLAAPSNAIALGNIPTRALGNVIARHIYRSSGGPYLLVGIIPDNRTTIFTDKALAGTTPEPEGAFASSVERELGWTINSRPQIIPVATLAAFTPYSDISQYAECVFVTAAAPGWGVRMPPTTSFQEGIQMKISNISIQDITVFARAGTTITGAATTLLPAGACVGWTLLGTDWRVTDTAGVGSGSGVTSISAGATGLTPVAPSVGPVTLGGTLNVASGGTGTTSLTAGKLIVANGASPYTASSITSTLTTLTNVPLPVAPSDVANKAYVDAAGGTTVSLDDNAAPKFPQNASEGVWYGLDTKANTFDQTCVTLGRSARTLGTNAVAVGTSARAPANSVVIGGTAATLLTAGPTIAIGPNIAPLLATGTNNVLMGHSINVGAATNSSVIVGHTCHAQGDGNVIYGRSAGNTSAIANNVFIGTQIANFASSAFDNVLVGRVLANSLTTGSNNVILGRGNDVSTGARTGCLILGSGLTAIADNATYIQRRTQPATSLAGWVGNELVEMTGITAGTYAVTTVGATQANIFTVVTSTNTAYALRTHVAIGSSPDAGAIYSYGRVKNVAGTLTLSPLIVDSTSCDVVLAAAAVTIAQTGTTLRVVVNGVAARTLRWQAYIELVATPL